MEFTFNTIVIPIDEIGTAHYNQKIDPERVEKMIKNFDMRYTTLPKVFWSDGKWECWDGQHLIPVLKRLGYTQIQCRITEAKSDEEIFKLISIQKPYKSLYLDVNGLDVEDFINQLKRKIPGVIMKVNNIGDQSASVHFQYNHVSAYNDGMLVFSKYNSSEKIFLNLSGVKNIYENPDNPDEIFVDYKNDEQCATYLIGEVD